MKTTYIRNKSAQLARRARALLNRRAPASTRKPAGILSKGLLAAAAALVALAAAPGTAFAVAPTAGTGAADVIITATANVTTTAANDYGVAATHSGTGKIDITNSGVLTTAANSAHGIYGLISSISAANIRITSAGNITTGSADGTTGTSANGIFGNISNATSSGDVLIGVAADGTTAAPITGTITTNGNLITGDTNAHGIYGVNAGSGNVVINTGATIVTKGQASRGVYANIAGTGSASIDSTSTVTTQGNSANGLYVQLNNALSTGDVRITSTGNITTGALDGTTGTNAYGIFGYIQNAGSKGNVLIGVAADGTTAAPITGTITTNGNVAGNTNAIGIYGLNAGSGNTVINTAATIVTKGQASQGIYAGTSGIGSVSIDSTSNITTQGTSACGMYGFSNNIASTANVRITSTGNITTGALDGLTGTIAHGVIGHISNAGSTGNVLIGVAADGVTAAPISGTITTNGNLATGNTSACGIAANNGGSGNVVINTAATIVTKGQASYGVYVHVHGTGSASIDSTSTVTTQGNSAHGIYGLLNNALSTGNVRITNSGNITTGSADGITGSSAHGIYGYIANAASTGNVLIGVAADGTTAAPITGTITTNGNLATGNTSAHGIAGFNNGSGNIVINTGAIIVMKGQASYGVFAYHLGTGSAAIDSTSNITTDNNISHGIYGLLNNAASTGDIRITSSGNITTGKADGTTGTTAYGINGYIQNATSSGNVLIGVAADGTTAAPITGTITTNGNLATGNTNAHGIYANNGGTGNVVINSAATIVTKGTGSAGIYATGKNQSTVIHSGNITTGGTGIYITGTGTAQDTTDYGSPVAGTTNTIITTGTAATGILVNGAGARYVTLAEKTIIHTGAALDASGNVTTGAASNVTGSYGIRSMTGATLSLNNVEIYTHALASADDLTTLSPAVLVGARAESGSNLTLSDFKISIEGKRSYAIFAGGVTTFDPLDASIPPVYTNTFMTLTDGTIATNGVLASGVFAHSGGQVTLTAVDIDASHETAMGYEITAATGYQQGAGFTGVTHTGGTLNAGGDLIYVGTNANNYEPANFVAGSQIDAYATLKDLTSVTNGVNAIRIGLKEAIGIAGDDIHARLDLTLDNTSVTGDVTTGTGSFYADSEYDPTVNYSTTNKHFVADETLWSYNVASGKATLNIALANGGEFNLVRQADADYTYNHKTTSDATGVLAVSIAAPAVAPFMAATPDAPPAINIGAEAAADMATNFLGTFAVGRGTFELAAGSDNVTALASAKELRFDANSVAIVSGDVSILNTTDGTVTLAGGTLRFNSQVPGVNPSADFLTAKNLNMMTGTLQVDILNQENSSYDPAVLGIALLDQQAVTNYVQVAAGATNLGSAVAIQDHAGNPITPSSSGTRVEQNGEVVATASYGYNAASTIDNVNHDGIYIGYSLLSLEVLAGKTLTIDNTGTTNTVLETPITGDGTLALADGAGTGLTVNGSGNDVGAVEILSGTVKAGDAGGLGTVDQVTIHDGATLVAGTDGLGVDIGALTAEAGSTLDLAGNTATVGDLTLERGSDVVFADGEINATGDALIGIDLKIGDPATPAGEEPNITVAGTTTIDSDVPGVDVIWDIVDPTKGKINLNDVNVGDGDTTDGGAQILVHDDSAPIPFHGGTTVNADGKIIGDDATTPGGNGISIILPDDATGPTEVIGGEIIAGDGADNPNGPGGNGGEVTLPGPVVVIDGGAIEAGDAGDGTTDGGKGGDVTINPGEGGKGGATVGDGTGDPTDPSHITGGNGGDGETGNGGSGGTVTIDGDGDTNVGPDGTIDAGNGGNGGTVDGTGNGGDGGTVDITGPGTTTVDGGTINGGDGGNGGTDGGNGGAGGPVDIGGPTVVINDGEINGGDGGNGGTDGGKGGAGGDVIITGPTTVDNGGSVNGGDGGDSYGPNNPGGAGGDVIIDGPTTIDNGGTINGGDGGNSDENEGGKGGDIIIKPGAPVTIDNGGSLNPGNPGTGGVPGVIINEGTIYIPDRGPAGGDTGQVKIVIGGLDPNSTVTTGRDFYNGGDIIFWNNTDGKDNYAGRTPNDQATAVIGGNYIGGLPSNPDAVGTIQLTAWKLSGSNDSIVDQVRINGNASGHTILDMIEGPNVGNGGKTTGEGILVISVGGTSTADAFALKRSLNAGFYEYSLYHGTSDQNWYLRSDGLSPTGGVILTAAAASSISWFAGNDNLMKRMGDLRLMNTAEFDSAGLCNGTGAENGTFWARAYGQQNNISLGGDIPDSRAYSYGADVGGDFLTNLDGDTLALGAFVGYVGNRNELRGQNAGGAKSKFNGVQAGLYATYMASNGFYADIVGKGMYGETDFDSGIDSGDYTSSGLGVSVELGWQLVSEQGWFVEPSVMGAYMHAFNDTYDTDGGMRIRMQDSDIGQFTGLVRFGKNMIVSGNVIQPYAKVGAMHQTTSGGHVNTFDSTWRPTVDGTSLLVGAGINWQVTPSTQIHLDYEASFGEKNDKPWGVNLGVTTRF